MDNQIEYLRRLNEWGESLKKSVQNARFTLDDQNLWNKYMEDFQNNIENCLAKEDITISEIRVLQNKGKKLTDMVKGSHSGKTISYGKHQLPPLPYSYDALEPYISKEIMHLHHTEHHQSYVDGLNEAEEALYLKNKDPIKHWLREQAFHGSGHYLHTIFWNNMTPTSPKQPIKEIKHQINKDFGSWKNFKKLFSDAANSVEGVGWAILSWSPRSGKLGVQTFEKHQLFLVADTIPLLVLDMWEHAYYLQYQTNKDEYIKNWWNVVNWEDVNHRFQVARQVEWEKF